MSSTYSVCFSFNSPNYFSCNTSEKPMIALSGVRSSCDMLARNSDLCWLADFQLLALRFDLAKQPRVVDRQRRLRREGLQQIHHLRFELSGLPPPHRQTAHNLLLAQERHRQKRAVTETVQQRPQPRSRALLLIQSIRDLHRRASDRRLPRGAFA